MRALISLFAGAVALVGCTTAKHHGLSQTVANQKIVLLPNPQVPGWGWFSLPRGRWYLESAGRSTGAWEPCDYVIFRKEGPAVHRLSFFRIAPTNAAPALYMYLDGLIERMGCGEISSEWRKADPHVSQVPMKYEPQDVEAAKEIWYSFFVERLSGSKWLSHAHLFRMRDGWTCIIVYSSTEVTSPEVMEKLGWQPQPP